MSARRDQAKPLESGPEFASLIDGDGWQHFTDLRRQLLYPRVETPQTIDILYWSKERASRRTVVHRHASGRLAPCKRAERLCHCVEADLGDPLLRCVSWLDPASARSVRLTTCNVRPVREPIPCFSGVARRIVSSQTRSLVAEELGRVQRSMEQQFAAVSH